MLISAALLISNLLMAGEPATCRCPALTQGVYWDGKRVTGKIIEGCETKELFKAPDLDFCEYKKNTKRGRLNQIGFCKVEYVDAKTGKWVASPQFPCLDRQYSQEDYGKSMMTDQLSFTSKDWQQPKRVPSSLNKKNR